MNYFYCWFLFRLFTTKPYVQRLYRCSCIHVAPSHLCDCLQLYTPSRTLCSSSDTLSLHILHIRLFTVGSHVSSTFSFSVWNDLPLPVRQKPPLDSFKFNLKICSFFLNNRSATFTLLCSCCSSVVWASPCDPFNLSSGCRFFSVFFVLQ